MITRKLKITNEYNIDDYLDQFNSTLRFAYNRFVKDGLSLSEVEKSIKNTKDNIDLMDMSFIRCASKKSQEIYENRGEKVIFGSKKNFRKRKYGRISNEEYKKRKNLPLIVYGESNASKKGNRKFKLDIIENNQVFFKPDRNTVISLQLPEGIRSKLYKELCKVQQLAEQGVMPVTLAVDYENIYIIYDECYLKEQKSTINSIPDRILSLDHNPNYVGITICDYDEEDRKNILHKEVISIKNVNDLDEKEKEDKKYKKNKRDHELIEVNKRIMKLANDYRIETVAVEDLKTNPENHSKGPDYNRLVNNNWNINKFFNNLQKRCNLSGVRFHKVPPHYSTVCGQIDNPSEYDMIASALEVGRRANKFVRIYIKQTSEKSPVLKHKQSVGGQLATLWEKMLDVAFDGRTYVDIWEDLKQTGTSYRCLFRPDRSKSFFSLKSDKSMVQVYLL